MSVVNIVPERAKIVEGKVIFVFTCPKCAHEKEIHDFGTRKIRDEVVKQSWCRKCRASTPAARLPKPV